MSAHGSKTTATSCLAVVLCLAVVSCGATGSSVVVTPEESAIEAASRRVDRTIERGLSAAWSQPAYATEVRYNPTRCDCPPWEVLFSGRWERARLVAAPSALPNVQVLLDSAPDESATVTVSFTRDVETAPTGWRYRILQVQAIGDAREE